MGGSNKGATLTITPRRRLGYSIALGVDFVIAYTVVFPFPYTTAVDFLAATTLFTLGFIGAWGGLAEQQTDRMSITSASHEFADARVPAAV